MRPRVAIVLVCAAAWGAAVAVACAVDIPDVVSTPDEAGIPEAGGGDGASPDAIGPTDSGLPDVIIAPPCDASCGFSLPKGFGLVLYTDTVKGCPAGSVPNPIGVDPDASAACSCGCTVTTQPDCTHGTIVRTYDNMGNPTCNLSGSPLPANGGACTHSNLSSSVHHAAFPPPPQSPGACTSQSVPDASAITSTSGVVCTALTCASQACSPPPGYRMCALATGTVACPAPFTQAHVVGPSTLACSSGCGTCSVDAGCVGVLHRFSDDQCTILVSNQAVDGGCTTGSNNGAVAYTYTGTPSNVACAFSGASTPTVIGTQTLCCAP